MGQTRGNAAGGSRPAPSPEPGLASAQRGPRAGSPGAAMLLRAEQDERGQQPGQRVHGLGPVGAGPTRRRGPAGRGRSRSCFSGGRGGGTSGREPEDARRGREGGGARRREPPHLPPRPPHSGARRISRPRAGSTAPLSSSLAAQPSPITRGPGVWNSPSHRRCSCRPLTGPSARLHGRRPRSATHRGAAARCPARRLRTDARASTT